MSLRNSYIPATFYTDLVDGLDASVYWVSKNDNNSQSFTTTSQFRLQSVDLYLKATVSEDRSYHCNVYACVAGKPSGSSLAYGFVLQASVYSGGEGWYNFSMPNSVVLSDATEYCLVASNTSITNRYARVGYSTNTPLSGSAYRSLDQGQTWDNSGDIPLLNFAFKVNGSDPEPGLASFPSPVDGAEDQPSDITLSWTNGANTDTVDVYFGTLNPPQTKVVDDLDVTTYNPGGLLINESYYWRIDTRNSYGTTTGDVFSFTVGAALEVNSKADLQAMKDNPTASYFITADINVSGGWTPVGNAVDGVFTGIVDGRNFTVSGFSLDSSDTYVGLFGLLSTNASIYDLNIVASGLVTGKTRCGIFAGQINSATVSNVHVSGDVTGKTGTDNIGGFAGIISGSSIVSNCSADGTILSSSTAGAAGGFVGFMSGTSFVYNCKSEGDASATGVVGSVGGFVGWITQGNILDCYSNGNATGHLTIGYAGGFVGLMNQNSGVVTTSYSTGTPSSGTEGGFCAVLSVGSIIGCYYDSSTAGQSDTGKGIPKITEDMMLLDTFIGWDFSEETGVWNISEEVSYPLFSLMPDLAEIVEPTDGGSGVSAVPLLDWTTGSPWPANSYDVYLGATSGDLSSLSAGQSDTFFQIITALDSGTKYYWRIDSTDQNSTNTGTEWSFTTASFSPPQPSGLQDGKVSGLNNMVTIKRLVAVADNKVYFET